MEQDKLYITFIRHGQTPNNKEGRFCGRTDYLLTEEGKAFIHDLVQAHPHRKPDHIYCSPATRCLETAALSYPNTTDIREIVMDIQEFNFGIFEARLSSEMWADPRYADAFDRMDPAFGFPGGEKIGECRDRGVRAVHAIIADAFEKGYREIAIITHSLIMQQMFGVMMTPEEFGHLPYMIPNGMGVRMYTTPEIAASDTPLKYLSIAPEGAEIPEEKENPYMRK